MRSDSERVALSGCLAVCTRGSLELEEVLRRREAFWLIAKKSSPNFNLSGQFRDRVDG